MTKSSSTRASLRTGDDRRTRRRTSDPDVQRAGGRPGGRYTTGARLSRLQSPTPLVCSARICARPQHLRFPILILPGAWAVQPLTRPPGPEGGRGTGHACMDSPRTPVTTWRRGGLFQVRLSVGARSSRPSPVATSGPRDISNAILRRLRRVGLENRAANHESLQPRLLST